jgi:DNA repair protein RadC
VQVATILDAETLLAPLFSGAEVERVAALHLGPGRSLIGLTLEAAGNAGDVELPVARILASALKLGAHGIIVAHNHPSGDPAASRADAQATEALLSGAAALGIRLYDHIIFAGERSSSFAALGLL